MHAHDIVKDFKKKIPKMKKEYHQVFQNVINKIPACHHFHLDFGAYDLVESYVNKEDMNLTFLGKNAVDINLPYDMFWLEFEYKQNMKCGLLVENIQDNKFIYVTQCFKPNGHWNIGDYSFLIKVGSDFNKEETIDAMTKYIHQKDIDEHWKELSGPYLFGNIFCIPQVPFFGNEKPDDVIKEQIYYIMFIHYLNIFLKLSNCKNVSNEDVQPTKKIQKKGKTKTVIDKRKCTYKILTFKLMGSKKKSLSESKGNTRFMPLHFCKGHFRGYYDKPLFGKIYGRFWIPDHVRGSLDNGFSDKDYKSV